ncbi:copper resistance protein CopC [Alphaproteobacteria bacterium]|nr:copper resistance protein CopC [Alphaproteobacteria bacterium]
MPKLVLAALAMLMLNAPALAHSKVSGSTPENGETVAELDQVMLKFERKVRLTVVELNAVPAGVTMDTLMAHDSDEPVEGAEAVALISDLPKGFVDGATVEFDPLASGVFWLSWIAVAQDGHVMEGDVHFAVAE